MSDPIYPSTAHPDELLAGYVDGTGTADERKMVDEHIAACAICHEEVELATVARAALVTLPELGAAGLAEAGVDSLRRAAFQTIPALITSAAEPAADSPLEPARSAPAAPLTDRKPRRSKVAWPQFLAAAAVVIVLGGLVAVPLVLSNGKGKQTASAPPRATPAPSPTSGPVLIDKGATYTTTTLDALATTITATARTALSEAGPATGTIRFATAPSISVVRDSSAASAALACLQNGGGPEGNAQAFYLEQAEVSGVPAYIGAFFIPDAKLNVMLIAVSRDGCQPLYSIRQSA